MKKRRICAVTANRADFSRIETMLEAVRDHPDLELSLVVMGSHLLEKTGRTIDEIRNKGFKIDRTVHMEIAGGYPVTMTKSVGLAIIELSTIFDDLNPDIVLVPVDRFESLAMGVAASLMNIHVAHTQGGEVTGTIDESIRHALTKLSHLHFVATRESRERLIKMGEPGETVFNVGCPGTDLLLRTPAWDRKETIEYFNSHLMKTPKDFDPNAPYFLVIQHPVTTEFESAGSQIAETLDALGEFKEPMIMVWPNIDAGSDDLSATLRLHAVANRSNMMLIKHIPSNVFVNVLRNAEVVIGNSSSGVRETCYFGTPTVNIGSRQNSRERGSNVIDVPNKKEDIVQAIRKQLTHGRWETEHLYGDGTAGAQFAEICATIDLPPIQKKIAY